MVVVDLSLVLPVVEMDVCGVVVMVGRNVCCLGCGRSNCGGRSASETTGCECGCCNC